MFLLQLVVQYHENLLDKSLFRMKAKIIALNTATSEAKFLKNVLCNLSQLNKRIPPILMHCDSQIVISKVTSKILMKKEYT